MCAQDVLRMECTTLTELIHICRFRQKRVSADPKEMWFDRCDKLLKSPSENIRCDMFNELRHFPGCRMRCKSDRYKYKYEYIHTTKEITLHRRSPTIVWCYKINQSCCCQLLHSDMFRNLIRLYFHLCFSTSRQRQRSILFRQICILAHPQWIISGMIHSRWCCKR